MNIKDIYENNDKIHEKTKQLAASLNDEQTAALADGGEWTVAHIFEHIAIVKDGMAKISAKLLTAAKESGKMANGSARLSENFQTKAAEAQQLKFEAPDRMRPTDHRRIAGEDGRNATNSGRFAPAFRDGRVFGFQISAPVYGRIDRARMADADRRTRSQTSAANRKNAGKKLKARK